MKKSNKAMVIDTSVARSAGESEHPVSKMSREFLFTFLESDNLLVTTPEIHAEWRNHRSVLAQKWLATMIAKKRRIQLKDVIQHELRSQLPQACSDPDKLKAMEKDLLLVEAALKTDRCVISSDNKVRRYLGEVCEQISVLRGICWVNPIVEEEAACEWLCEGAKPEKHRMLGFLENVK